MKIRIYYNNIQDNIRVGWRLKSLLHKSIQATLKYENINAKSVEVSITFADNESIRQLNNSYRGIDRPTDVLSFPLEDVIDKTENNTALALGDIVISLQRAQEQANEFGHSFDREVAFLCIHSMLHLLGYDHELGEEQDKDMRQRQRNIIKSIGLEVK